MMVGERVDLRRDRAHALARALARTSAEHALFSQAVAARLGLGPTDLDCLALLYDLGPATPGQLADVLRLTSGAITGVVDRLVAAGFVVRETDAADRRRVIVQPVAGREPEFEAAQTPFVEGIVAALESASDTDLARLLDFQNQVADVLRRQTTRQREEHASRAAGAAGFSAPLGDLDAATLEFASGAAEVRISALDPASEVEFASALYTASFAGAQPTVRVQAGAVTFRFRRIGPFEWGRARHSGVVALNPGIAWTILLRGGASGVVLDGSSLLLREVSIDGGVDNVEVCLPPPSGTVAVRLDGGVHRVRLQRPFGVPAELQVSGGANRLDFDDRHFGAVGGDVRLTSPEWERATNRYAIDVRGGASRLSVLELQEGTTHAHDL